MYDQFMEKGIDEIYCVSVNDGFVMRAWAKEHTCGTKVQCIADGNGDFTRRMGMLVEKNNLGFGMRSWRYAAVINNGIVEQMFAEEGIEDNHGEDPYVVSTPQNVYVVTRDGRRTSERNFRLESDAREESYYWISLTKKYDARSKISIVKTNKPKRIR